MFQEKKEERDALLKKVRELKRKKLEEEARLSEPGLRKTKLTEVCIAVALPLMVVSYGCRCGA